MKNAGDTQAEDNLECIHECPEKDARRSKVVPLGFNPVQLMPRSSSPAHGSYYTLQMLQQPTSLSLGLIYNLPDPCITSLQSYTSYSYWSIPDISNTIGNVVAVLDEAGNFGIKYESSSDGAVYIYQSDTDEEGLFSSVNQTVRPLVLQRLILQMNDNLRLYCWKTIWT